MHHRVEMISGEWHDMFAFLFAFGRSAKVIYGQTGQDHSYEEIRSIVLDILSGRAGAFVTPQYENLKNAVARAFAQREGGAARRPTVGWQPEAELSRRDRDMLLEVFWSLFREALTSLRPPLRPRALASSPPIVLSQIR